MWSDELQLATEIPTYLKSIIFFREKFEHFFLWICDAYKILGKEDGVNKRKTRMKNHTYGVNYETFSKTYRTSL